MLLGHFRIFKVFLNMNKFKEVVLMHYDCIPIRKCINKNT